MAGSSLTDDVFQALSDPLRREILCIMDSKDREVIERDELSEILAMLYDISEERVATALDHHHLPKLDSAGLVEYDTRSGIVRYDTNRLVSVLRQHNLIESKTCCDECEATGITQNESVDTD
jgi:DNA-binding transcriptional ArsR family regulator